VVVLDGDGTVVRANERAESLLRMSTSRMEGQSYYEPEWEIRNEDGAVVSGDEHPITQVFETGEPILGFQHVIEFLDGVERWFSTNAAPVFDESGDVERVVVALEEITQLKEQARRLERRRDELESELEEVFDRISDGFYGLDEHFRFTYVNDRAETLLDLDESDVVGRNIRDVLDVTEPFDEALQEAAESAEPVFAEDYYDPLGGWFENVIYPSETGLSVYFRDITERKERERELEQYETIVETADDGIYAVDDEARFVMVNDRFCELTGYDRDELIGAHATTIHPDEVTPEAEALVNEIADGQRNLASIDLDIQTKGGDSIPCESRLAPFPIGDSYGRCGVVRDISARIEQEQTLKKRVAQQEVVTELGQRALENQDVDDLMREASRLVAETLDVAYCKVLELDDDREKFLVRQGVGWDEGTVGAATVSAIEDDSQASYTLASSGPVVVENLEADSRFSGPELLTSHDVQSGISVVIGAEDDPWGILGVHDTSHAEFSDHDVNFVQSVSNILATAISRRRDEEALLRQQEQLAALNSLNEVVREIIDAVIDQSTREEIERTVCEHLADTDSYMFAWIGDVDPNSQTVTLRTEAGVDGYLDDITISVDDDDERSEGATGRALRTGVTQTTQDVEVDSQYAPWREHVAEHGFRSSAAVPIVHEGTTYGVLNVYAQRPNAFEGEERHVIDQLGEVVGHAIAATERKRALMSDEVVELEFQIQNLFEFLDIDGMESGRISIDHSIPIEGDEYLVYGHATADAVDTLKAIVETTPHWREVTFHDEHADTKFELVLSEPPILSALASVGGSVVEAVIEDGTYRMKLHVSPSVDVRQITDAVQSAYPAATLLKRHQITRSGEAIDRIQRVLSTEITDRQRAAIEAAFHAGYFEWPRDATGEDVARSLGVSPPTFHQHLRKAQQQVFSSLLTVAV
jgi:PAS domain S-box-containing protein